MSNYTNAHASEMLAKSEFSFRGFEILETPESSIQDFVVKNLDKYYGVQVKSSQFNFDKNRYIFECRKRNFSKRQDGSNVLGDWKPYPKKEIEFFVLVARDIRKSILIKNEEQIFRANYEKEEFIRYSNFTWDLLISYINNDSENKIKINKKVIDLFNMEK
jgi:putative ribosome biogenesis GTPase RsgA